MKKVAAFTFASLLTVTSMSSFAVAHPGAINLYVNPNTNQLFPFQPFEAATMGLFAGIEISAQFPGFGVSFPANGVLVGETLEFETTIGLMYWDGSDVAPTDATMTIEGPTFDSDGNCIYTMDGGECQDDDIPNIFPIDRESINLSGLTWGTYSGTNFWEADGLYLLNPLDVPSGVYGLSVRIDSPSHEISDPFLFPFIFDPMQEFEPEDEAVGIAKLTQTVRADFNYDGVHNVSDADLLVQDIASATNSPELDLNEDGVVTLEDLDVWLEVAGGHVQGGAYLPGDANLDGAVDGPDFLIWNDNKFGPGSGWSDGDFNADGLVDGLDFLIWNSNKFQSAALQAVPEPAFASCLSLCVGIFVVLMRRLN